MVKNVRLMIKILYANFPGLSPAISARFTLEMCVAVENCPQNAKTPYSEGSRLFKVIDVGTIKKLVTNVCYDDQYICVYL